MDKENLKLNIKHKKLEPWSRLNSESVMKNGYFEIVKDTVRINNQPIKNYTYMKLTDSAMVVAMTKDKKLVLIRQFRYLVGDEVYEFPAGGCEENEDPETCARRECEEEAGYKIGKLIKLGQFYETYGLLNRQINFFFSNDIQKTKQNPDNNNLHFEEIEVELFDYQDVIRMANENKIVGAPSMLAILLLKQKIDSGKIVI